MIITVILAGHDENARTIFDGMFRVARAYKSTNNMALMSKEVRQTGTNCANAAMPESQTDGDLDIATALLMADKQWGSGGHRQLRAGGAQHDRRHQDERHERHDRSCRCWATGSASTTQKFYWGGRSADFIAGHLRAFGGATSDTFWIQSVDAIYGLVAKIQMVNSPTTGLLPDFVINTEHQRRARHRPTGRAPATPTTASTSITPPVCPCAWPWTTSAAADPRPGPRRRWPR